MDTKAFLKSKTIWGLIVTLLGVFGLGDLLPADFAEKGSALVNSVLEFSGIVLAAYGRYKAEKPLSVK